MFNPLDILDGNHPLVFVVSASATAIAAGVAYANLIRAHHQEMAAALTKFLDEPGNKNLFDNAERVMHAHAWAVLDDAEVRDLAGRTLSSFCKIARTATAYAPWHAVLEGDQMHILTRFLAQIAPLICVVRHTPLALDGKARFYNGNKRYAAAELYKALKVPDPDLMKPYR